jgi:tetratricopeptide (TPR) repeat protein
MNRSVFGAAAVFVALTNAACTPLRPTASEGKPQAISLLGAPLHRPVADPAEEAATAERVARAKAESEAAPDDAAKLVWHGRMLGVASRFDEAVAVFEDGARRFPEDPRVHRFLGHRYITLRRFDDAVASLTRAAKLAEPLPDELEPATKPGGAELESMKHAIYYHLGLAHFLKGDFAAAEPAYRLCLENSGNFDSRCSASHWLWMTLERQGKRAQAAEVIAAIAPDQEAVEYHAYRNLIRLYAGALDGEAYLATLAPGGVDFASFGFGLANWHLVNGRIDRAFELFGEIAKVPTWAAFGCIGAEAELAREKR